MKNIAEFDISRCIVEKKIKEKKLTNGFGCQNLFRHDTDSESQNGYFRHVNLENVDDNEKRVLVCNSVNKITTKNTNFISSTTHVLNSIDRGIRLY